MSSNLNYLSEPPQKTKAAPDQGKAASENAQRQDHTAAKIVRVGAQVLNSRSTSTLSQRERALELLNIADQTTYSLRKHGISHPAQRLRELINDGYPIAKSTVTAVDSDGYTHTGVALYSLEKPSQPELNLGA